MQDSKELDDFEFQAFCSLRKWRLERCRELGVEPYKIFQNRTFCEMVRRRRNNPMWAREALACNGEEMHSPKKSTKQVKDEIDGNLAVSSSSVAAAEDKVVEPSPKVIDDLLLCWGVGPSKAKWPEGFAHEALAVLNEPSVSKLLCKSLSVHQVS
jgi:hypothetical protein